MRPTLRTTSQPADAYRPSQSWAAEYPADVLVADFSLAWTRRADDEFAPATGDGARTRCGDRDFDRDR